MTKEEAIKFLKQIVARPNDSEGNSRYPYYWRASFAEIINILEGREDEDNDISKHLELVEKVLAQAKLKEGESKVVKCPKCGGDVIVSRSSYNGHYHASCEKCGMGFCQ